MKKIEAIIRHFKLEEVSRSRRKRRWLKLSHDPLAAVC
jgi:nitrogen regulatory protein PII